MNTISQIIKKLKDSVKEIKKYPSQNMQEASWGYEQGVLISGDDAQAIIEAFEAINSMKKYPIPHGFGEYGLPRTEFLLHRVKDIERKAIKWCKEKKYAQGDGYDVSVNNKGQWVVSYSNDYPMQHGDGKSFVITEEEFKYLIHNYV
jgi:hypothetical protein